MGILKVFLFFTSAPFIGNAYVFILWSVTAFVAVFFLARRKSCNPLFFGFLGAFFWGYALLILAFVCLRTLPGDTETVR